MFINYHRVQYEMDNKGAKLRFNSHLERGFAHNFTEKKNFYHCITFMSVNNEMSGCYKDIDSHSQDFERG